MNVHDKALLLGKVERAARSPNRTSAESCKFNNLEQFVNESAKCDKN